ncbi:T-cell surface glycoprotein CD8 beta chain [Antennarius striatus]|uniref:T-cell surface glycoprotein CD8 beta chain n=1 Tax=Antennarius striatus TaxID=241820 RepID=UPI0035B10897
MIQPLPPWALLTVLLWRSVSGQILQQENILYPKLLETQVIICDCTGFTCISVYWYRSNSDHSRLQFLGKVNNAGRVTDQADSRFRLKRNSGSSFALQIIDVRVEDAGIYSCVLTDVKNNELWKHGILLLPGVIPPTLPPPTESSPTVDSDCCRLKQNSSQEDCASMVLWLLVGLTATLAGALLCTLYCFSRLPKKCRHRFVKKR